MKTTPKRQRRRYSKEDREKILLEYASSDQSQAGFAASKGISVTTFQNWLRKSRQTKATSKAGDLIPVRLVPGQTSSEACGLIEIELPTGLLIRLSPGFDPDEIRTLVKILTESC